MLPIPQAQPCCRSTAVLPLIHPPWRDSVLVTEQQRLLHASAQRHAVHRASREARGGSRGHRPRAHLTSDRKRVWPGHLRRERTTTASACRACHQLAACVAPSSLPPSQASGPHDSHHRVYIVLTLPCFTLSSRRRPTQPPSCTAEQQRAGLCDSHPHSFGPRVLGNAATCLERSESPCSLIRRLIPLTTCPAAWPRVRLPVTFIPQHPSVPHTWSIASLDSAQHPTALTRYQNEQPRQRG